VSLPLANRGGAADARAEGLSLAGRFRRHADALERDRRSPLSARLMRAAATDLDAGGIVADVFDGIPMPPGAVPQLRLLGALHHLVLAGKAPELATFYPTTGGAGNPQRAWPAAEAVIREHAELIRSRLRQIVQTNEPGRSTVLYPALLWLTAQHRLPIRLLEIGASAGLNLLVDRYSYVNNRHALGAPASPVRFEAPWHPPLPPELVDSAQNLSITSRAGCDLNPLNPRDPDDRITILSYIWPDELDRFHRISAALDLAAADPPKVTRQPASTWLTGALEGGRSGELTVVWQSVFRQYLEPDEWSRIEAAVTGAIGADAQRPVAWLIMEPGEDHLARMRLTLRLVADGPEQKLAECGDHGPPVHWTASAGPSRD
jgi:hypothetical protein